MRQIKLSWPLLLVGALGILFLTTCGGKGNPGDGQTPGVPLMVTVPDVVGLQQDDAETAITGAGLGVGVIGSEARLTMPTGTVVRQGLTPGDSVQEGTACDLDVVSQPPVGPGEAISATWAGEWEFNISFRPAGAGNAGAVEVVTDAICPGDPLGLALFQQILDASPAITQGTCTGTASDTRLTASCTAHLVDACTLDVTMSFAMDIFGNTIVGTGLWTALGNCGPAVIVNEAEHVVLSGVRLNANPGNLCAQPPSSLMQKFLRHAYILSLVEEGLL